MYTSVFQAIRLHFTRGEAGNIWLAIFGMRTQPPAWYLVPAAGFEPARTASRGTPGLRLLYQLSYAGAGRRAPGLTNLEGYFPSS